MREKKIFFPSGGIQLEGLLSNQEALSVRGGVILCHPHPQFGGDMYNSVISTASEAAWQEGFSTLRFNFRGVGESQGAYGGGKGEQEDVRFAIEFFLNKQHNPNRPLIVLGYSFGAWAGLPVGVKDERVSGLIAVAPPLQMMDFNFLKESEKRKLIIVGTKDLFCPVSDLEKWFQTLTEPKSLSLIQGADHFFSFHQEHLVPPLKEFLKSFE